MSIEQKIREILAEDSSEELVEAKKSPKLTWSLPTGTKRGTSRSRKIVAMIKEYADRNGLRVHETHHEGPSDFNKKADVTIHHLSPNQRGDNEPRPAEVTLSPHAESHEEHGPWLKKLLSSAETAAYNEPDWMDEDVDYNEDDNNLNGVSSMQDYVDALTNGEELTEEFKEKAAVIFEAAVVDRVKSELQGLQEAYEEHIEEELTSITEGLIEKVDGYLNYIVEQWMTDNEIALERGMKSEILESFVGGLKTLFEQHDIDIPEEKVDVLEALEENVESLSEALDEQFAVNVQLNNTIAGYQKYLVVDELSEGLVATDREKFQSLVEDLDFGDTDTFSYKAQTLRESFFTNKVTGSKTVQSVVTDSPVFLEEERSYMEPQIKGYTAMLDKLNK